MKVRTIAFAMGALLAFTAPTLAHVAAPARPARRVPADAGVPDALLPPLPQPAITTSVADDATITSQYAAREQADAKALEPFAGGEGVSIYIGGGVLTAIVIVALIVILL